MPKLPALRLLKGHTIHQRTAPFKHRFKYSLTMIDIDIDRLDEASKQSVFFSIDRSNLFSFNRKDHGNRKDEALRPWAEQQFSEAGVVTTGCQIRLVTFARHVFYKFSPISLWLCFNSENQLSGILYEVNNTFGETHTYAATTPRSSRNRHIGDKVFHVSPFFDISGKYQFTLRVDDTQLSLIIATMHDGVQTHLATIKAKAKQATSSAFLWQAITRPFSSLAVSFAIHWQALKLWIKGAKYHSKPIQSETRITTVETEEVANQPTSIRETAA